MSVTIHQYGNKYFVFEAKDVKLLRCEYRIVGALSGTLAQFPLQNTFYGLPLLLLPEEVELIKKHGFGTWISKKPTPIMIKENTERLFHVFEYFWTKGFYITSGIKFGGNYLLYQDDPMCTHSDHIVNAYEYDQSILPLDLISMGRIGTNVKKTFVLAGKSEEEGEDTMLTFSVEWAGF